MAKLRQLSEQEMFESKKRFNKLLEYSFVNQEDDLLLDEDDDTNQETNPAETNTEMPAPEAPDPNTQSAEASVDNNQPQIDTSVDPNVQIPDEASTEMNEPMESMPAENEIEIDVTDLTSKQDDIDVKVSSMAAQNQQMMDLLTQLADKVSGVVKNSEMEMSKLKDEIIKRNPTPVETLQKRITVSDPFTVTPAEYWKKKELEGHYRLSDDDNVNNKEYIINNSDISNSNPQEVYRSFGIDDDEMNQSIATMFKI